MPVQKGKRRNRPGGRRNEERSRTTRPAAVPVPKREEPKPKQQPARRGRFQPPYWVNALLGFVIVVLGVYFFLIQAPKVDMTQRFIFLLLYLALGGFYLGKAFQQYRRRNQS